MDLSKLLLEEQFLIVDAGDPEQVKILLQLKETWNQLAQKAKSQIKHKGIVLKNTDLRGTNLADVLIEYSYFSGSDLSGANLTNRNIEKSNFSSVNLYGAQLMSARMSRTNLSNARLYDTDFSTVTMTGSVNLFDIHIVNGDEELYRTHPNITRSGFKMLHELERAGEDNDNYM